MRNLTKKVLIKVLSVCFMLALTFFAISLMPTNSAKAEATESAYAKLSINDMVGYSADGATYSNGQISLTSGQRFGFNGGYYGTAGNGKYKNVEVSTVLNYTTKGNLTMSLRTQGTSLDVFNGSSYTNKGYGIRLYSNTRCDFYKNGTKVIDAKWPPSGASISVGVDSPVVFKTVDLSDGSVQITLTINGINYFTYNDAENPITDAGWFTMTSDGSAVTVKGTEAKAPTIVDLTQTTTPITSANLTATVNDTTVIASEGTSGASYAFTTDGSYGYKVKVTPSTSSGRLVFQLGGTSLSGALAPLTTVASWPQAGYVMYWNSNGQMHLANGNLNSQLIYYGWIAPGFTAGTSYTIEYSAYEFEDGSLKIAFKINGSTIFTWFDTNPVQIAKGSTPTSRTVYNTIHTMDGAGATYEAVDTVVSTSSKTLLTKDLGEAVGNSTLNKNGEVTVLGQDRALGYNANLSNTVIKFNANFTTVGNNIAFTTNYQGSALESPWGGDWTKKGYAIILYSNGQVNISKNGTTVMEGWQSPALTTPTFATNTNYEIEVGTVSLTNAVKVFAKINGKLVASYLDTSNHASDAGWFTVYNTGFTGSLTPYGVDLPTISTSFVNDTAKLDEQVSVNCLVGGVAPSEPVELFIDSTLNTANASVNGNVITATQVGQVKVYALCDGLYSNDLVITFEEASMPILENAPATIIFGSTNPVLTAKMSDDAQVTTKVFKVENGTGSATINETTGELTPVSAGTISVWATLDGKDTAKATIKILPVITVTPVSGKIVKGEEIDLDYTSNCNLPNDISVVWGITNGNNTIATVNGTSAETNGIISAIACGDFKVKVNLSSLSIGEISSEELTLTVVEPVLTNIPSSPIIANESAPVFSAKWSDDSASTTITYHIVNVSGEATIDETTGELNPTQAGTVRVYATVDGFNTAEYVITIIPIVSIEWAGSFAMGGTYALSDISYDVNCNLPNETISVAYEIIEGASLAQIVGNNLVVGNEVGIIGLRVIVTGETFQAVSELERFAVEEPIIITHTSVLKDLYVGQSVTLNPSISQGGFDLDTISKEIVVIEGGDLVQITGLTIKAIGAGTFKFKVKLGNTTSTQEAEFAIEELEPTIIASSTMINGKSQTATVTFNADPADYTYTSLVWSISQGADVAVVNQNGVITPIKEGTFTLKVVIDGSIEKTLQITVIGKVALTGISNNQQIVKGNTVQLSYRLTDEANFGEVTSVEYIIVNGESLATITADGKLTLNKVGEVQVKVKVNGISSNTITIKCIGAEEVGEPETDGCGCNSFVGTTLSVGFVLVPIALIMLIKKTKKEN